MTMETSAATALDTLVELLQLEQIEANIFRGYSQDLGFRALFGGQVLGQALSAMTQTVPQERKAHSLHGYFLRPGDANKPVLYTVERIRDGGSFTTRRVVAVQKGQPICFVSASYQKSEQGFEHQNSPPQVPGPEGLRSEMEIVHSLRDRIPEGIRSKLLAERPIEVRPIAPVDPFAPQAREPVKNMWLRAIGSLPDDPSMHRALLTYASDFSLVGTALLPHARTFWQPQMQVASLDHSLWFHRNPQLNDWILYTMDSPAAQGGRGLNRGAFYTRDGVMIASVSQEGVIRERTKTPA